MLVARVEASKIMKYWNGPILIHTELVRFDSNYKETDGVKAQLGWIDFSK